MEQKQSDLAWLLPMAAILTVATLIAGPPDSFLASTYSFIALFIGACIGIAKMLAALRRYWLEGEPRPASRLLGMMRQALPRIVCTVIGVELLALFGAAFTTIKLNIPAVVPYYADHALAAIDLWLFGQDPWRLLFIPAIIGPLEVVYNAWVATQMAFIYAVILMAPSPLKTRAVLAYVLTWFIVGGALAYAFSSVGPVFYDRLYGGTRFAGLADMLALAPITTAATEMLPKAVIAGGLSAMPSMHVAGSLWMALVWRERFPRLQWIGWAYLAVMYYGSIALGWHYATDGIVGMLGAHAIFASLGIRRTALWRTKSDHQPVTSGRLRL